jgi:hypothetical protein
MNKVKKDFWGDVDQNIAVNSKNVPYKGDPPIQTVFDFSWLRLRDYHSVGQVYSQEINHISKIVAPRWNSLKCRLPQLSKGIMLMVCLLCLVMDHQRPCWQNLSKPRFDYDKRYISVVICDTNKSVTVKTKSWWRSENFLGSVYVFIPGYYSIQNVYLVSCHSVILFWKSRSANQDFNLLNFKLIYFSSNWSAVSIGRKQLYLNQEWTAILCLNNEFRLTKVK